MSFMSSASDVLHRESPRVGSALHSPLATHGFTQAHSVTEECTWQNAYPQLVNISPDGSTATAHNEMTCVAVLGCMSYSEGVFAWTVIIESSRLNYGGAICIGVTDGEADFSGESGGWSCGFNPYSGALFITGDAYRVDYHTPSHALMHGDLQGKANNAAVTVLVDLAQQHVAFSINGSPPVLARTGGLPAVVRPWVHLFKQYDSVSIGPAHEVAPWPAQDKELREASATKTEPEYSDAEQSFAGHHALADGR